MPRQARIDAPGALHHIIIRGNEQRAIFLDDHDRDCFLDRLGRLLIETGTPCFAWCLMTNHVHLLLRTGQVPVAAIMRSLLTGYAQQFNRRYGRYGHLFQNRYKSILCEEEPYLSTLVQYIHLNPIRAGLIKNVTELEAYKYTGHGCLNGNHDYKWQDKQSVLLLFACKNRIALRKYNDFVSAGIEYGKRPELTGGGLVRSFGGWAEVRAVRDRGERIKGDERILGSSQFVELVLIAADEKMRRTAAYRHHGLDMGKLIKRTADYYKIAEDEMKTNSKAADIVRARALACYLGVRELGVSATEVARQLNITPAAVSKAIRRGKQIAVAAVMKSILY